MNTKRCQKIYRNAKPELPGALQSYTELSRPPLSFGELWASYFFVPLGTNRIFLEVLHKYYEILGHIWKYKEILRNTRKY